VLAIDGFEVDVPDSEDNIADVRVRRLRGQPVPAWDFASGIGAALVWRAPA
jgi:hypothetical protein